MKIEWKFDKDYEGSEHTVKDLYIDGRRTMVWIARWGGLNATGRWRGATKNGVHVCTSEEEAKAYALALYTLETP